MESKRPDIGGGDADAISKSSISKRQKLRPSINAGEDIVTEILLRLPVKSVVKFQTVSKLWLSIVSSHRFRQTHASRHTASATALLFKMFGSDSYKVLPLNINLNPTKFLSDLLFPYKQLSYESHPHWCRSSCNGLQLLQSFDGTYYVHNPTTKQYKALNVPQHISKNKCVYSTLAFDPSESLHYKVVFLCPQQLSPCKFDLEVYSSATGQCTSPVNDTFSADLDYKENRGVFYNGAVHWLQRYATSIIYFNLHTECINELRTLPSGGKIRYLGESRGHLHLVKSDGEYFDRCSFLYAYELEKDYSGWFVKYRVDIASIKSRLPRDYAPNDYGTSLSIVRDEEEDNSVLLIWIWNEWVEYNFKQKTTKRLFRYVQGYERSSPFPWTYWFNTYQIIPTLTLTGRKVEDPDLLDIIRLTIINNLLKYHPESREQLATGEAFGVKAPEKKLDVDIATHIHIKNDGPKRSLLYIETADRPGFLLEVVKIMADINISVESAEVDTEGLIAKDTFHVSYREAALNDSMYESHLGINCCLFRKPDLQKLTIWDSLYIY